MLMQGAAGGVNATNGNAEMAACDTSLTPEAQRCNIHELSVM